MKILLVSQSILPYKGGSSVIVENLAKNFSKDEIVVVGSRKLKHPKQAERPKFHYFLSELSVMGRGARFFNWFRRLRFKPLKRYIRKLAKEEKVDYIIGVYPNSFYCLAACQVASEMNIPFSSYFHNTYVENVAIKEARAQEIQDEIFSESQHIFVMSEGMEAFYEEKYGLGKFVPLVHTFQKFPAPQTFQALALKEKYKLIAIGNFNESNIDATKRFIDAIGENTRYELSIYTHVPKLLLQSRGLNMEKVRHLGFIHPDRVHEALQDYDICVLTHGFEGGYGEVEYRTIFPTRTIPFLLSGKPIYAHSPPQSFLSEFIKQHNCAQLVDVKNERLILEGLEELVRNIDLQKRLHKASAETVKMFYGPTVAKFLKSKLTGEDKV